MRYAVRVFPLSLQQYAGSLTSQCVLFDKRTASTRKLLELGVHFRRGHSSRVSGVCRALVEAATPARASQGTQHATSHVKDLVGDQAHS